MNKLRLGAVAVSTAAGIYCFNQSDPVGEQAPAPTTNAPAFDEPIAGGADALPSPMTGDPFALEPFSSESFVDDAAPNRLPAAAPMMVPRAMPEAVALPRMAAPAPLVDDRSAAETTESAIPSVEPRLPGGKQVVRVYYGTNRAADPRHAPDADPGEHFTAKSAALSYGVVEVSVPKTHQRGSLEHRRWYMFESDNATKHFVLQRIVPTEESVFLNELNRDIAADPKREAFVFIHGFGTSFEAAAWRTGQLKADLEFDGPAVMYSWPSRGLVDPLSYFRDRDSARDSRDELMQFLETVGTQTGAEKIHVIAHSMGNFVLAPVLAQLRDRPYLPSPMFDQLVLAAPDISAELFLGEIAGKLDRCANRTTIYAADNDYALKAGQLFVPGRRLGTILGLQNGPKYPFIEVVDTGSAEFRLFEVGHSDYGGPVLGDLRATLAGLLPNQRGLAEHHLVPVHWELPAGYAVEAPSGVVQVGHSTLSTDTTSVQPIVQQAGIWDTICGWWPW